MTAPYALTLGALITLAYRKLGILPAGGSPTDDQFTQGVIAYNLMATSLQADAPNLFRLEQLTLAIPTGVGYAGNPYQITPRLLGVSDARWVITPSPNLYERPMARYAYADYDQLPNKMAQTVSPSVYAVDPQVSVTNIYFWPLPSVAGTCNMLVSRPTLSVSQPADALDFPPEWHEDLSYNLADRLMDNEGVAAADQATATRITQRAVAFQAKLENFDRPTSVFFRPWGKAGRSRVWR